MHNAVYHHEVTLSCRHGFDEYQFQTLHEPLSKYLASISDKYIFQLERGSGTHVLHYQGYCHTKKKIRSKQLAISSNAFFTGIRIVEASKAGTASLQTYCLKDRTRVAGPWADRPIYRGQDLPSTLFPWQSAIVSIIGDTPDSRIIYWIYDPTGCTGKSVLTKIICYKFKGCLLTYSNTKDLAYVAAKSPTALVYAVDLPRCKPKDNNLKDLFATLEQLKNGMIFSTKYVPETVFRLPPHVIVFSNYLPNLSLISMDRWKIAKVNAETKTMHWMTSAQIQMTSH